jgi:hypothetical protein
MCSRSTSTSPGSRSVLQVKEIAENPFSPLGYDDRCSAAIPCRRAARFGVSPTAFLGLAGADKIVTHDQSSRHRDAHLERLLHGTDSVDEHQSRPDCTFGIVFVRVGIAEIHQHAVTHEAVELGDSLGNALVIGR